ESVPCEYAFDIKRTSKGTGILCGMSCKAWHWEGGTYDEQRQREAAYVQEHTQEAMTGDADFNGFVESVLILKYGYYVPAEQEISNLRTVTVDLPVALFQDPRQMKDQWAAEAALAPAEYKRRVDADRYA